MEPLLLLAIGGGALALMMAAKSEPRRDATGAKLAPKPGGVAVTESSKLAPITPAKTPVILDRTGTAPETVTTGVLMTSAPTGTAAQAIVVDYLMNDLGRANLLAMVRNAEIERLAAKSPRAVVQADVADPNDAAGPAGAVPLYEQKMPNGMIMRNLPDGGPHVMRVRWPDFAYALGMSDLGAKELAQAAGLPAQPFMTMTPDATMLFFMPGAWTTDGDFFYSHLLLTADVVPLRAFVVPAT